MGRGDSRLRRAGTSGEGAELLCLTAATAGSTSSTA